MCWCSDALMYTSCIHVNNRKTSGSQLVPLLLSIVWMFTSGMGPLSIQHLPFWQLLFDPVHFVPALEQNFKAVRSQTVLKFLVSVIVSRILLCSFALHNIWYYYLCFTLVLFPDFSLIPTSYCPIPIGLFVECPILLVVMTRDED